MTLEQVARQADALPREVERLLQRVECSTNHYEALGIARSATNDQVRLAYQQSLALLQSSRQALAVNALAVNPLAVNAFDLMAGDAETVSTDELREKIDQALDRV